MDKNTPSNTVGTILPHAIVSYAELLNMRKTGIQELRKYPNPPHNNLTSTGIPHSDAAVVTAPNVLRQYAEAHKVMAHNRIMARSSIPMIIHAKLPTGM